MNGRARTIRYRLGIGLGLTVLMLIASGIMGVVVLSAVDRDVAVSSRVTATTSRLLESQDASQRYAVLGLQGLLAGRQDQAERLDSLSTAADSLRRSVLSDPGLDTDQRSRIESLGGTQQRAEVRLAVAQAYADVGDAISATHQATLATAVLDSLYRASAAITSVQREAAATSLQRVTTLLRQQRLYVSVLLLVAILIAVFSGIRTFRSITRPMDALAEGARRLAAGDLQVQIDPAGFDHEYVLLASAFGEMVQQLRRVITRIQTEARAVADAATALGTASDQTAASTGEISAVMAEIAREAESQRHSVEASKEALSQVSHAAELLAQAATRSRTVGTDIRSTAERTREGIAEALSALGRAQNVIGSSAGEVGNLNTASESVAGFVDAIANVARQTRLLALNASIEAARAGEQGAGFAVVAEHVGRLSSDSARAAADVRNVVENMRRQVGAAVQAFRAGVSGLGDVDSINRSAAAALDAVEAAVAEVESVAGAVVNAAESAESATQSLATQLTATGEQAEAQAASSEQAAAAAQETAATAQEVAATSHTLTESAARLEELVAAFKV